RAHGGLRERARLALAGEQLDRGGDLRDPDPRPRLPPRGPPRRTHAGGGLVSTPASATPASERPGLSGAWWRFLARLGLQESRWRALPGWQQRLVKFGAVSLLALVVLAPIYGFDAGAYFMFLVIGALYVPDWSGVRFGRLILPAAVLAICVAYPYYLDRLPGLPIFTAFPTMSTAFVMAIYVMMALGLNIVVGYA